MKKKIMSIITAAGMLLTLAVPMTAHAEESASIWETYTFEEFLALSEEEVCAISEETADTYTSYKDLGEKENADSGSEWNMPTFWFLLTDEGLAEIKNVFSTKGDLEGLLYVCDEMHIDMSTVDTGPDFMDWYVGDLKCEPMSLGIMARDYKGVISSEELTAKCVV